MILLFVLVSHLLASFTWVKFRDSPFNLYIIFQDCISYLMLSDEADVESLGSSDVMVLDQEGKTMDEETDLSLASSPSLPEDLPAIK